MKTINKTEDAPEFEVEKVQKLWEREYSPFTLSSYEIAAKLLTSGEFGKNNLTLNLLVYKNGKASQYRSFHEQDSTVKAFFEVLIKNKALLEKVYSGYISAAEYILDSFKKILDSNSFDENFITSLNHNFGNFAGHAFIIQRGVDYLKDYTEHKEIYNKLVDLRKKYELVFGGEFEKHLRTLWNKIGKNMRKPHLLGLMSLDELIHFLRNNKLPNNLEGREKGTVISIGMPPVESLLIEGKPAEKIINLLDEKTLREVSQSTGNLQGLVVYDKSIKGEVQIIKDFKDLDKFKQGKILVVPSTLPKYELCYKKAIGIIADEGGLLSHAAIFCREFKIPGIIGTKHATKLLKDGDIVELKAKTGVVRILKNE